MADLNYRIGIDTGAAQRALAALQTTIVGFGSALAGAFAVREVVQVSARFEDLRITLQTLYRDRGAGARVFNDIKEFAKTSAFAVEDLVQTVIKLKTAGIEPNIALLRLFADVSGSVADRVGALQAITDLYARTTAGGLGLEDLNRLADRGIPVFQILSDKLGLGRLELSKFGQTAEGAQIILKALEVGLNETFSDAAKNKLGSLGQAMSNFRDTVNNLIDIFGRLALNKALTNFINALGSALEDLKPYIALIGVGLAQAFQFLADNIKIVVAALVALFTVFTVSVIVRLAQAVLLLSTAFGALGKNPIIKTLTVIVGLLAGLAAAFKIDITGSVDEATKSVDEFDKVLKELERGGQLPMGQLATDASGLRNQLGGLNSELKKFNAEMQNSVNAYALQNAEQLKSFNTQTGLIQATEEQRLAVETLANAQEGYLRAIAPLLEQYNQLSASGKKEDLEKLPAIRQALKDISKEYENSLPLLQEAINKRIQELQVVKELQRNAELLTKAYERRADVDEALNDLLLRGPKLARDATDSYINSTLTPLQRKLNEIAKEERDLKDATIKRIAAQYMSPDGEMIDADGFAQAVDRITDATNRNIQIRQAQARSEGQYQTTFTAGWVRAFRDYKTAAEDASKRAASLFNRTVQGMEDLFVNFAKTGKFEWKRFLNDLGEEILRSQLRQLFAGIFGDMTKAMDSGQGFMGMLGKLLGFGDGAGRGSQTNPMYVIDLASVKGGVGIGAEQGGGFLSSLWNGVKNIGSSIISGVSSLFGGGSSGGGGFFSSIVKGIGSLFGGFFANGGTLGAGRWGIAGERGPELITGPATVTPMMGSTYVTYNISAVDAMSFKQMIARDPSFIHAVAQQGAKGTARRY